MNLNGYLMTNGRGARWLGPTVILAVPGTISGLLGNAINLPSAVGFDLLSDRKSRFGVTVLARFRRRCRGEIEQRTSG